MSNYKWPWGYEGLVKGIDPKIKWVYVVSDNDYQGDSLAIGRKGKKFCRIVIGWGSCSGCDAYQAAEGNAVELEKLKKDLARNILWFTTRAKLSNSLRIESTSSFASGVFKQALADDLEMPKGEDKP